MAVVDVNEDVQKTTFEEIQSQNKLHPLDAVLLNAVNKYRNNEDSKDEQNLHQRYLTCLKQNYFKINFTKLMQLPIGSTA